MVFSDTIATMTETDFQIKTEVFEGPLDLLLSLVEKRKLFISDISLSQVTDEFIQHVERLPEITMEDRANFIVVASTLLLVKSKSLLPTLDLTTEEEDSIDDLEKRLKILQKFRDLSIHVKDKFGESMSFEQAHPIPQNPVFAPHESLNRETIFESLKAVINALPKKEKIPTAVVRKVKSLEETIDILTNRISANLKMSFKDFSKNFADGSGEDMAEVKVNIIVGFLAMLELVKQGIISVEQEAKFGDIQMESQNVGLPSYKE